MSEVKYSGKGQVDRLVKQHEKAGGVEGIFGKLAKDHDISSFDVTKLIFEQLSNKYTNLDFQIINSLSKQDINKKLNSINSEFGTTLFVDNSSIRPDGGILEVKDTNGNWRVILTIESKHQGNDIEKIKAGVKQGKNKDQDLMMAGNAIERVHKNILEMKNFMIDEPHFPYVVFYQGTNFATETFYVESPDGRKVKIGHDVGSLNRIDRTTASNFSSKINEIYVKNKYFEVNNLSVMFQIPTFFYKATPWGIDEMFAICFEVAERSLDLLKLDLDINL